MNNTPNVVVRDRGGRNENSEIGKELSHAHKLICQLRHAGATWDDLVAMRDAKLEVFSEFIARIRGISVTDDRDEIINLDYEPGSFESLTDLSKGFLASKGVYDVDDDRLGIWQVQSESWGIFFGNMKFSVERPSGKGCFQKDPPRYCRGDLLGISKNRVYLNLAMATWFSQGGRIDIPFDGSPFNDNWGNDTIFFLGTVWWVPIRKVFLAPALTSNKSGHIKYQIWPIPVGKWPENCYVALLVPR